MSQKIARLNSRQALDLSVLIRCTETRLLELFSQGKIEGTIHACIGQELSAVAFCSLLSKDDFVFSNHRGHGHFLALTNDVSGLVAEVMGKTAGVCGGYGGSQHLCKRNFYSNGIQGGIVPVAAGLALAEKIRQTPNVGIVFIGDGTLGEGCLYEAVNLIAKLSLPLLIVCEDNGYAQSTPTSLNLAGTVRARFEAFGLQAFESNTENVDDLLTQASQTVDYVRQKRLPAFHHVHTYRLCAHSKKDDHRDPKEIENFRLRDPITKFSLDQKVLYTKIARKHSLRIEQAIELANSAPHPSLEEYMPGVANESIYWEDYQPAVCGKRYAEQINSCFHELMEKYPKMVFIGEDILSPYGGAFKICRGLSDRFPERVLSTPISEAAITGLANGLAISGFSPFVEIMFGDFMTLCMDQIINHASKFHHMYNRQVICPLVIRTPMGGHRGYGPTHSQTLDKFLLGIENVKVLALNRLVPPSQLYEHLCNSEQSPVIVIENKQDYSRFGTGFEGDFFRNYRIRRTCTPFPSFSLSPQRTKPDCVLITYGGSVTETAIAAENLFKEHEILSQIIILTQLYPLPAQAIVAEIMSDHLFVIEEGSTPFGFGSEVISVLIERGARYKTLKRIGALCIPIPASRLLEEQILLTSDKIIKEVVGVLKCQ